MMNLTIFDQAQFTTGDGSIVTLTKLNDSLYEVKFERDNMFCTDIRLKVEGCRAFLSSTTSSDYFFDLLAFTARALKWTDRKNNVHVWKARFQPRKRFRSRSMESESTTCTTNTSRASSMSSDRADSPARGSKQAQVKLTGSFIEENLSSFYHSKDEWKIGKNGKYGPPALRGENVVLIPAKKMIALKNVHILISTLLEEYTIEKVGRILQRKSESQLKGYLLYFELANKQQAESFMKEYFATNMDLKVPDVRIALDN